ncbi:uncharacterized protein LOC121374019 isoform X2 [Gigantopelta aegis]|nr:uncharacterized protein LOC121374019 isoform X2 [Gigantopelta aegis]
MKPVQRRGESFNVGKSKARNKETRSPQDPPWPQTPPGSASLHRNYVNCDSYSQGQLQRRQYSESHQNVSNRGLSQTGHSALTKSTPSLNDPERKPPDLQGPMKVQHPVLSPSKSSPDIKKEVGKENRYNQRPTNLNIKSSERNSYTCSPSPRENSWNMYGDESGRSYLEKPNLSIYTSGEMAESKNRKYERRSLPPHLHRYQADYENISALGTTPLQSEKISEIEDESDDSPDMPPRSPDIMPGSIPMPPIRDPSTLKFVRYSQVHEKYPSWPVTKANGAGKQAEPIATRAQSWTDHTNTNKELVVKAEITRPSGLNPLMENRPQTERKGDDGTKRIGSDPGLKTQFVYDKYGRVRRKNYDNVNGKKFEDFLISKPGYPPPMFDSDGHNYGDKEYSVPSPPERDMPGVELSELSDKLVSSSSASAPDKRAENVHSNNHSNYIPKDSVQGDSRRTSSHEYSSSRDRGNKLDSGTSPMNSPLEEKHPLRMVNKQTENKSHLDSSSHLEAKQSGKKGEQDSSRQASQGKAYIVKQTPYYNTSTQTDVSSYAIKSSVCRTEPRPCNAKIEVNDFGGQTSPTSPDEQRKLFEEKSIQARMSCQQQDMDRERNQSGDKTEPGQGSYFNFSASKDRPNEKATFEGIESIKAKYATDEDPEEKFENASSYIPHYTEYTPSMAPILRKLSEEFYRGRLPSLAEKHLSSASSQDAGHQGGLKEAESYSSVVIHPSESSGPFGRDEFGSRSSLSDSRCDVSLVMSENVSSSRASSLSRGRHSLDPSIFSHRNRQFGDPRYSSSSSVLSHDRGKCLSGSEREGSQKDYESVPHENRLRSSRQSSDSSVPSQPKSSSDTRSSGSTQFSDSPQSHVPARYSQDDMYNDSVFVGEEKSPVSPSDHGGGKTNSDSTGQSSASVTRKHSMKKAYGIFEEGEGDQPHYKDFADQKALASSVDYVHMHQPNSARSDSTPLDQIQEEGEVESSHRPTSAPSRTETMLKSPNEKKVPSSNDWRATRDMWRDEHAAKRGSLKRTTSEQIPSPKERSDQCKFSGADHKGLTGSYKGTGPDPSKITRLDDQEVPLLSGHNYTKSDSSETKKQQQQALLSFFERKTGKKGVSGSCSSQDSDQSPRNSSSNQYDHISPSSPTSSVNDIITKASENLKNSKAKRSDSLRRSGSSTSSPRSSADYVDMNRQRKVTEWSQLRSQGSFSYSPGPSNRSSFASEHPYEDISVFSPHTPRNSMSERPIEENGSTMANSCESPLSSRPRDLGVGGSMDSGMVVSPTYQNLYQTQRRPPPPLPSEDDTPPALPPRNYRKQSAPASTTTTSTSLMAISPSPNEPGPQVTGEESSIDSTKLEFRSLLTQWETHSPREESQYADQLRKQASRRYSEQHRPNAMPMSIIQSRTKINFSTSFKREPMIAQEATQPGTNSSVVNSSSGDQSQMVGDNSQSAFVVVENNNNNINNSKNDGEVSQKLLQKSQLAEGNGQVKRERILSDVPPMPSPPLNIEEVKSSDEELPPPPPALIEGRSIEENGENNKFADDSYGAYVSRSRREVGTYKRSISAATLNSDNNNYKLCTEASSQFSDKPLGKHSWNSDSALSKAGSSLRPAREPDDNSVLRSSKEAVDSAPLKTVRESNDESQLKSNAETNDGSHLRYSREISDDSQPRRVREANDVSQLSNRDVNDRSHLRANRESDDASQLRSNRESGDSSHLRANRESSDGSQLRANRESGDGSHLRANRESGDGSHLRANRDFNDVSRTRYNKEVNDGSQLSGGSHAKARRDSNDSRAVKGAGACESSGPVPTFKVESSNVRTGVRSSAHALQSPLGGIKSTNHVYSPRPFVSDKSPAVNDSERNSDKGRTFGKTPSSVRDRIHKLEKETVRTVGSPASVSSLDSPSSSEPIRTSSPKHNAGQLSSNSSWKTQENLCSPTHNLNSNSQRILDSWEEDKQKKKFNYASTNSDRKGSSGDVSAQPYPSPQRHKDQSAPTTNKTTQRQPEHLGGQRTSSQSCNHRYSDQSRAQNLRNDLDSSMSSNDSGIDRTQDRETHKGQRSFNNSANQRLHDSSVKHSVSNHSQRESANHPHKAPDSYGIQGSQDNFSPNRQDVQFDQKSSSSSSSEYTRNQRDMDNVGIQRRQGQFVDDNNKPQSDDKSKSNEELSQNLTVENVSQESMTSSHGRQPSQEEIECDLQAQELAKELEEKDKKLCEVLRQDPNKKRMQYMDGIFTNNDVDRKPAAVRRSPNGTNFVGERKVSPESNTRSALPATYFKSPPKALVEIKLRMNEEANKDLIGDIQDNDALKKQKEELMEKLYVKLDILKEEKMSLEQEIIENEALGKRVKQMVEERCRTEHEKQKFFSYIDDLEKIVRLLLNLAGQLARAENAIQSLPDNVDPKIKKMTIDKKERLNSKQEDAKRLKEDIDDRSDQVSSFLKDSLLPDQFEDYCYYIKMKSKLTIDFQELEDKLTLGDEQIQELRKSIPDK